MTSAQRAKRRMAMVFWRVFNPMARALAGWAPWWVVLETTGRRTGQPRRVPLARGPRDGATVWLISVHGRHASFARNIEANPNVRLKLGAHRPDARADRAGSGIECVIGVNMYPQSLTRFADGDFAGRRALAALTD